MFVIFIIVKYVKNFKEKGQKLVLQLRFNAVVFQIPINKSTNFMDNRKGAIKYRKQVLTAVTGLLVSALVRLDDSHEALECFLEDDASRGRIPQD